MDRHFIYKTDGVCAQEVSFDIIDGILRNIKFIGGCKGNIQGVERLAEGMQAEEVILRLKGIECHGGQSCPNELAKAVERCLKEI